MTRSPMLCLRLIIGGVLLLAVSTVPAGANSPWVYDDWEYRMPFDAEIASIEGSETFGDFSMLVTLDGLRHADVFANAKPDGSDLLFVSTVGSTILEREIVHYDAGAQEAEVWVRVPGLSKFENEFYLYFGNALASFDPRPTTAWSSDYRAVYHFEENPEGLVLPDSSPQGADIVLGPTHGWTSTDVEPAQVGNGWRLNGSTHHLSSSAISTADSSYTLEAWLTHDDTSTHFFIEANPGFWHLSSLMTNETTDYAGPEGFIRWNPRPIPLGAPQHHYLWKFDAVNDTMFFFFDGVPQTVRLKFPDNSSPIYTGRLINPDNSDPVGVLHNMFYIHSDAHSGLADEFRLREGRPSPERILTEFRNADDPVAFVNFGSMQSVNATSVASTTTFMLRSFPNPSPGPSSIRYSLPVAGRVHLSIYDVAGRRVAELVDREMPAGTWIARWNGRAHHGGAVAAGLYFLRLETPFGVRTTKITLIR